MIRIGMVGKIESGDDQGKFVKVQELPDDPPSYLVHVAADDAFKTDGGDDWVEDYCSLEQYFAEANWVIVWEGEE
ncbi:hypothetical protein [Streptomyces daqingensis]|nr:hypothetical protein [Streptomyces daqingensis]